MCRTQYPLCQYILFVFSNDAGGYVHHVCITDRYQLLIVLYRVCTPFTRKRLLIFSSMTALFVACIVFLPGIFSLVRLSYMQFVLTGAGMAAIPFVMDFFFRFGNRFKLKERLLKVGK